MTETPQHSSRTPRPARRRQARGEKRMEQLLEAAGRVFHQKGFAAATTNAIAKEAQVSPGTLYQFFPNKEALAVELGRRYNQALRDAHSEAFTPDNALLPLDELLDAVVDPILGFCIENPAFHELLESSETPGDYSDEHDTVDANLLASTQQLVLLRAPELSAAEATQVAQMAFAVFKGGLTLVLDHTGELRDAYTRQLKRALYGYLAPVIGTDAPARG
ncbi:TetR/AcrR family transcriptional regulator [Streptomyces sp. NPDC051940]|uniref:TetR/AcrR family transcriptional regulator n=1 Tax=Streptomyces sp. NPDC051940 TaxID=3155675 RepID=UPI0034206952